MKPPFSKAALEDYLLKRIHSLKLSQGFTTNDGWNQVDGKGEEKNRLYGEWAALHRLLDELSGGYIK